VIMNALGVDVSRWQRAVDWQTLRKGGAGFAVIKASQGTAIADPLLRAHFDGARDAGLLTGVYHWVDPTQPAELQVDHFLKTCSGLEFDFAALDVEQYWQSWQEWTEHRIVRVIHEDRISACAREAAELLRQRCGRQVLIYTRASFVQTYAEPMQDWLPDWPLWLAHYPYARGRVNVSWENLIRQHLPKISGPNLPPGVGEWQFWQFSGDRFVLPGCPTPLDLDFFNGSETQLRAWCRGETAPAEELSDSQKLRLLWEAHPELRLP